MFRALRRSTASLLAAGALLAAGEGGAATLAVNSTGDDTTAADGFVTLREAILAAETDGATDLGDIGSGADTIVFAPALVAGGDAAISVAAMAHASLGPAAFSVATEIAIEGPSGDDGIAIVRAPDVAPLPSLRLFTVLPTGSLTLANLTLSGGNAVGGAGGSNLHPEQLGGPGGGGAGLGGAVYNRGAVVIRRCTVSGNVARGGSGGRGPDETGVLLAQSAGGSAGGGGLAGAGGSVVAAGGAGGGGGSLSSGASAAGDTGGSGGGALPGDGNGGGAGGAAAGEVGTPGGAGGGGGGGGALANGGEGGVGGGGGGAGGAPPGPPSQGGAGGFGGGGGGALFDPGDGGFGGGAGTNHVVFGLGDPGYGGGRAGAGYSYMAGNFAGWNDSAGGGGGGAGLGGAVFNHAGMLRIETSTFSGNEAIAGAGGYSPAPHAAGLPGSGLGGAIFDLNGSVEIVDSTFADNSAQSGPDLYALAHGAASGITLQNAGVTLSGVIFASAGARNAAFEEYFGAGAPGAVGLDASAPNLMSGGIDSFGSLDASGVVVADAKLGPLADGGGPTATHAPLYPGSPAVDAGAAAAAGLDQRGEVRPSGPAPDLGSVEIAEFCGNGVVEAPEECDDGNTAPGDGCSLCQVRCAAQPVAGCTVAGAASLAIDERRAGQEKLSLSLKRLTDRVDVEGEFGDPVSGTTRYAICVYGPDLAVDVRLDRAGATCGAKACWKATGLTGYAYADPVGAAEGVTAVKLKAGLTGKGAITAAGANDARHGETSLVTGAAAALAGATSATAQIVASDGECFAAELGSVKKADGAQFKAKSP